MPYSYESLKEGYQRRWDEMEITRPQAVDAAAQRILRGMPRYKAISKEMGNGIPPEVIGVIHLRESDLDFGAHLHNGDRPLSNPTRHVPRGRGPFDSFEDSAVDALRLEGAQHITDWDIPRQSWFLEKFNGFGYQGKSGGNPYLYGGTNQYSRGKYVADGVYDSSFHDPQLGVMAILKQMGKYKNYRGTRDDVVKNSSKLTFLKRLRLFFVGLGGTIYTSSFFDFAKDAISFVKANELWFIAGAAAAAWLIFKWVEYKSVDDHLKGNYTPSGMAPTEDTVDGFTPSVKANVIHSESPSAPSDSGASTTDNSGATGNG